MDTRTFSTPIAFFVSAARCLSKTNIAIILSALLFTSQAMAIPIVGSAEGTFINPTGSAAFLSNVQGVGTNEFKFGQPASFSPPSELTFSGNDFSTNSGNIFTLGSLSFFNGVNKIGTADGEVDLNLVVSLTDPQGVFDDVNLNLRLKAPFGADFVTLPRLIGDSSFEANGLKLTLDILGFGKFTSSGIIGINKLVAGELKKDKAFLFARVLTASVPEPETALLLLAALFMIGLLRKQHLKNLEMA